MRSPWKPLLLSALFALPALCLASGSAPVPTASGIVFEDRNGNGARDAGEPGIGGVCVSNQRQVVKTDRAGRYSLPITDDTILFVIKPTGYRTRTDALNVPRFYRIHKPAGSPKQNIEGVAPTGPLPRSIDFALTKQREPDRFKAILMGDTQVGSQRDVNALSHQVLEELVGTDAAFGITLGDNTGEAPWLFPALNQALSAVGVPWYHVLGNHDENYDSVDDTLSTETFQRVYGPPYYSYNVARVHFIVLDDVVWSRPAGTNGGYSAGLGSRQLEYLKNDLALTPKDRLVVLMMHIPLSSREWNAHSADREGLFRLLEDHPYSVSVSGHTHTQRTDFMGKDQGWNGAQPHQHIVNGAACGTWWGGAPDALGLPQPTMRDGAPNGYSVFNFDGNTFTQEFKAARRPWDYQMNIDAPEEVASAEGAPVYANVFNGSSRSTVEMSVDGGPFAAMAAAREVDPVYKRQRETEIALKAPNGFGLVGGAASDHLWKASLPAGLAAGAHTVSVRTTDVFGQTYSAHRIVRVK